MTAQTTTLPRRLLARRLLALREAAKLTRDKAAKLAEISSQTLWRLENGQVANVKKMVVRALCDVYSASDNDREALLWLTEEARKTGWWQSYSDAMFDNKDLFVVLEQSARRVTSFQLTLLPGLVQTADYRRAMAQTYEPPLNDEEIDRRIELLTKRQARHEEASDSFVLEVLLSEAALHHRIGGAAVMADQVRNLVKLSKRGNVSIRIVPLAVGGHLGLQVGSFVLLEFPKHPNPALTEPPVVYVEGYTGALYLDKPDEIEQYRTALSAIDRAALNQSESRALLVKIAEEYEA
ncbi:transcriptional regulator with XRE-family HTH domain [Nocardia transvalensis]|uniref:Transcriptional regulator with XRE-family HTH domain n=1 Tax=Nocardia transvalensis TaxID=37333 RepID=A0A7W9PJV6_9NOCA|nr:helix-turn-helix transcriptional regulator [Nocardia transvalensis]MBB5917465.1 transcriptional regulator with XRE-family HTH domain [Nocardia transvalensis]